MNKKGAGFFSGRFAVLPRLQRVKEELCRGWGSWWERVRCLRCVKLRWWLKNMCPKWHPGKWSTKLDPQKDWPLQKVADLGAFALQDEMRMRNECEKYKTDFVVRSDRSILLARLAVGQFFLQVLNICEGKFPFHDVGVLFLRLDPPTWCFPFGFFLQPNTNKGVPEIYTYIYI